ncbi:slr1658 superfamily regulator [Capilliphycus salinus ALCB114379]|uniref:slr1658 superfamily regulator n=1 Tax=Capilliphycus salinus TaxID=2768948 RepID=UPI0039A4256F
MSQIFGDFVEISSSENQEFLAIGFSPGSIPLQQRWRNNGLSANFMADYVTTFFPKSEEDFSTQHRQAEIQSAVSFIANELLENAMKFSDNSCSYPIQIKINLSSEWLSFWVVNSIAPEKIESFQDYIQTLLNSDPQEMYINQIEENLEDGNSSRLGYLTMINDYQANLGWKFETVKMDSEIYIVTTVVKLAI